MTCRQCGTEIAEKALICYRCGTATTEAQFKPPPVKRSRAPLVASAVALVMVVALVALVGRSSTGETPRFLSWVAAGIAVVVVAIRAYARRR